MSDKFKLTLAFLFLLASLLVPFLVLTAVWYRWDFWSGVIAGVATFALLFLLSVLLLFRVRDLSWFSASLPYAFGSLYAVLPDILIGPLDDGAASLLGALFSFALALRRSPQTPKWLFLLPLVGSVYIFLGGVIPGPMDELLVSLISYLMYAYGTSRQLPEGEPVSVQGE